MVGCCTQLIIDWLVVGQSSSLIGWMLYAGEEQDPSPGTDHSGAASARGQGERTGTGPDRQSISISCLSAKWNITDVLP